VTAIPTGPIDAAPRGVNIGDWPTALHAPLAGIELGAYDERILAWIAGWDTPTVATIASLLLRARAAQPLDDADASKPDFPSGSDEPPANVSSVRCVRTGAVWTRTVKTWCGEAIWTDGDSETTWYQLNQVDPMSEGFDEAVRS
jgi:hypothetical protein